MATSDPTPKYTNEELDSDNVSKKEIIEYLIATASSKFLREHKLMGAVKNVAKQKSKDVLIKDYNLLFETKDFKCEGEEDITEQTKKLTVKDDGEKKKKTDEVEEPKYKKRILKGGNKVNFPRKGDVVSCFYTGKLADGTVFDQNAISTKKFKKAQALKFKVGVGQVIKGWDQGLMTMSVGEKAELIIEPEWAYGKKGCEGKVPPNATLYFEVELLNID
ncbi:hypothetical protein CAPTEDRAFT_171636 [Capitella teleta]|uniref:peptidylprolyl isomerase n=1 Tax=Capitella teleta TaxID=283909 RepID=R7VJV5_CAPTE|nr:hypothetical protein CAPTEDRAFT_171636 [Capitella teleta]|eukprot:ELU16225.1 hypothetical protein CAPTEDRAFT_171636 [Capitella teleta]